MNKITFPSEGIGPNHSENNCCYVVRNLIVDTRTCPIKFWHESKRLVKFLNRDMQSHCLHTADCIDDTPPEVVSIQKIEMTLFIMYDDYNKTSGHFFIDCFPRLWYYERGFMESWANIGLVYPRSVGEPAYNPCQILDIKYKHKTVILENDKVYQIDTAIIPGIYTWWSDMDTSKRFVEFVDSYFDSVVSNPETHRRFYLSREDVDYRKVPGKEKWERRICVNENELIEKLKSHGVVSKTIKNLSATEFIQCFRNKEQVIGMEGSGWNYIMLCSPNTEIVTLVHPRVNQFLRRYVQLLKYKDYKMKFVVPSIEIYDRDPNVKNWNSHWRIVNLDEVVNQIVS